MSATDIRIGLELEAPQTTSLSSGLPVQFPQLNSYVLIPSGNGHVVCVLRSVWIERSPFPRRPGLKDFDLIDLPFPLRKLSVAPIGTMRPKEGSVAELELVRGVYQFPSVGDPALVPSPGQLRSIIESSTSNGRVSVGYSPLAGNVEVRVDPDRMFGRHLAVLGNTGSGKSCTVAGLVRWSVLAARAQTPENKLLNARFVVLDPNGEYLTAFKDLPGGCRVFQAPPLDDTSFSRIALPAWMWNSSEWIAFAEAAPRTQRPLLLRALRELKGGDGERPDAALFAAARLLAAYRDQFASIHRNKSFLSFPGYKDVANLLERLSRDLEFQARRAPEELAKGFRDLASRLTKLRSGRVEVGRDGKEYPQAFADREIEVIQERLETLLEDLPAEAARGLPLEDAPVPFDIDELPGALERLAQLEPSALIDSMVMRIRSMLSDGRKRDILLDDAAPTVLIEWIESYLGMDSDENSIAVIDLSLIPQDVVHMFVAVFSRLIFETIQRYRKANSETLPTVLVVEEAHTFIQRGRMAEDDLPSPQQLCRQTFEKIAREGRKFGLGLVLSSQRPSELSPTALSQCNTFMLHRIVNDQDQELVRRLIPDNVSGILAELPSLPSRQGILLGWATSVPVLIEVHELAVEHRPESADPEFWDVWTQASDRSADWTDLVQRWVPVRKDGERGEEHPADPPESEGDDGNGSG
ncbi:MAG: DUF87 domain-containing protein [Dehalococcoidia bacterium]